MNASTGTDVPGGSASLNLSGCTAGQFLYASLPSTITLQANTSYHLVSQELNVGDRWYDYGTVSSTQDAAVNSSIYSSDSANWFPEGAPNTSYVPPNFLYTVVQAAPIAVTVQASLAGASFTVDGTSYNSSQTFSWTAGSSHTIAATSPQSAGVAGTQYAWSSWSDGGAISHTVSPAAATTYTVNFTTQYQLTTSVSPTGGGTITANPSSSTGYYNTGSQVTLTATPNSVCTFTNWSGGLSGPNPQTVTMSGPISGTANFQCSGPAQTNFLTGYGLSAPPLRNNFTGWVGMRFTVGVSPLIVSSVGRICAAGNSGTHTVKFVNASTGTDVPGGSASLNLSGCSPGQFFYGALASPITLQENTPYYLVSQEISGGDQWYDYGTVSSTQDAAVNSSIYSSNSVNWLPVGPANSSYVPLNFQYWPGTPDSTLITGYTLNQGTARNDFSGWVGMKFTVGPNSIPVNSLGRLFLAGNSGTHTVKLVRVSDGSDVPGGSVSVSMAGGTVGVFSYAALPSQITLLPNTAYYLVSQESAGGDQWYDYGPVSASSAVSVNNAVYFLNGVWNPVGGANTSYVPPNLK